MVHAFIMVKTAAGKSEGLLANIRDLEDIYEAHIVAGNYDIIAEIEAEEIYDVLEVVSTNLQGLEGVTDTKTYIAMD
ncbi:Lrp/AsnC family transcriptional regulator [Natronobacterium gregoryi]|uniref:Transcriptional regulator n=2 Tax=Natronobacterium gregoryi TaxID=44930 RepID=L0AJ52_NATGS|nr:Lrp/AsnC family transcriptional regulator [Natronobacterium gregoryi]AFZ73831.1 transcriptional regulator [Natronobacterium gregoryi SP2]ELY65078.1 transcription regulator, AsnC-type [Natronobacterium gregoryi SP2]PLK19711.1 Lrp/AsnC family transcriptional regulator [Natronobacterium gregoryi SP2]SFJ42114.1 transcriptional regulator, AsnC family [Natronobacterium gregoryi]